MRLTLCYTMIFSGENSSYDTLAYFANQYFAYARKMFHYAEMIVRGTARLFRLQTNGTRKSFALRAMAFCIQLWSTNFLFALFSAVAFF